MPFSDLDRTMPLEEQQHLEQLFSHYRVPDRDHVYLIGAFARSITVVSQQTRAINLIQVLLRSGTLGREKHLVVVGAGMAGLSAAAAAADYHVQVTLLERDGEVLQLIRHSKSRWLHPYLYHWPERDWFRTAAELPYLDWQQDSAANVASGVDRLWTGVKQSQWVHEHLGVSDVHVDQNRHVTWKVGDRGYAVDADVVIVAAGFGEEYRGPSGEESLTYWRSDDLEGLSTKKPKNEGTPTRILVSGNGDGGAIDVFRLRFKQFDHEHFFRYLKNVLDLPNLGTEIQKIEQEVRAKLVVELQTRTSDDTSRAPETWQWLTEAYLNLPVTGLDGIVKQQLSTYTEVVLTGRTAGAINPRAFPLNRLLLSSLIKWGKDSGVSYQPGKFAIRRRDPTSDKFRIEGVEGQFDKVVIRHGIQDPERDSLPDPEGHTVTGNLANILGVSVNTVLDWKQAWQTRAINDVGHAPGWFAGFAAGTHRIYEESHERVIKHICDAITRRPALTALELTGILLRVCRTYAEELRRFLATNEGLHWVYTVSSRATSIANGFAESLTEEDRNAVIFFIHSEIARGGRAETVKIWQVARALAEAIDELHFNRFTGAMFDGVEAGDGKVIISPRPLDVVSIAHRPRFLRESGETFYGGRRAEPTAPPDFVPGETVHAALMPHEVGHIRAHYHKRCNLQLAETTTVGIASPCGADALDWRRIGTNMNVVFPVIPRDAAGNRKHVEALTRLAAARGVNYLLMPEYVFPDDAAGDWTAELRAFAAVVLGSQHEPGKLPRHRAALFLRDAEARQLEQPRKLSPARHVMVNGTQMHEGIDGADIPLDVYFGSKGSLAVVHVSDVVTADLLARLLGLRPPLVLMLGTALSPDLRLDEQAADLSRRLSAVVAAVHMGFEHTDAVLALPYQSGPPRKERITPPSLVRTTLDCPAMEVERPGARPSV